MEDLKAAFFGCWGQAGHYMFAPDKSHIRDLDCDRFGFPKPHELDGSRIFLPYPEIRDHGRLTYLSAPNLSVLSWWNGLYDTRGAVNSHFMYPGNHPIPVMWHCFGHYFPDLQKAHKKPFIGVTY